MLSDHEQRSWDELARRLRAETGARTRLSQRLRTHRERATRVRPTALALITLLVIGGLLLVEGAVLAGLALVTAAGLAGLLWHFWPWLVDDAIESWATRPGWRDTWQVPAWAGDASTRQLDGDKS